MTRHALALLVVTATIAFVGTTTASADYGKLSQYQVTISENCNSVSLCGGQTGGFWGWYVFNSDGTGDAQLAGCGHTVGGVGGPGGAGAGHESVDFTWTTGPATGLLASPNGLDFYITSDETTFTGADGGTVSDANVGDTGVPAYPGHYSATLGPGTTVQVTVARKPGT
jgi:hypothetical protein